MITTVYSDPMSGAQRQVVANLFVGEWIKYLEDVGEEVRIRF